MTGATDAHYHPYETIPSCIYIPKSLGKTSYPSLPCDCPPASASISRCGENCINRLTNTECSHHKCSNIRFQTATISSIQEKIELFKTENKGMGIRAKVRINPQDFIVEYAGEVVTEKEFFGRQKKYQAEGYSHFYFMLLQNGEFIDATKCGNLARFINHSCRPNAEVQKWIVGDKVKMGIFCINTIEPGQEIAFDYKVDRYGADAQVCFCGEPNCIGLLGGKVQTNGSGLDGTALSLETVSGVMTMLMQSQDASLVLKLVSKIVECDDALVHAKVMRMHGYEVFARLLDEWKTENQIVNMILQILDSFPKLTKNKIVSSKIDVIIQELANREADQSTDDEEILNIKQLANSLLQSWSKLKMAYRIPRKSKASTESNSPPLSKGNMSPSPQPLTQSQSYNNNQSRSGSTTSPNHSSVSPSINHSENDEVYVDLKHFSRVPNTINGLTPIPTGPRNKTYSGNLSTSIPTGPSNLGLTKVGGNSIPTGPSSTTPKQISTPIIQKAVIEEQYETTSKSVYQLRLDQIIASASASTSISIATPALQKASQSLSQSHSNVSKVLESSSQQPKDHNKSHTSSSKPSTKQTPISKFVRKLIPNDPVMCHKLSKIIIEKERKRGRKGNEPLTKERKKHIHEFVKSYLKSKKDAVTAN